MRAFFARLGGPSAPPPANAKSDKDKENINKGLPSIPPPLLPHLAGKPANEDVNIPPPAPPPAQPEPRIQPSPPSRAPPPPPTSTNESGSSSKPTAKAGVNAVGRGGAVSRGMEAPPPDPFARKAPLSSLNGRAPAKDTTLKAKRPTPAAQPAGVVGKKVAFISPPPTPNGLDSLISEDASSSTSSAFTPPSKPTPPPTKPSLPPTTKTSSAPTKPSTAPSSRASTGPGARSASASTTSGGGGPGANLPKPSDRSASNPSRGSTRPSDQTNGGPRQGSRSSSTPTTTSASHATPSSTNAASLAATNRLKKASTATLPGAAGARTVSAGGLRKASSSTSQFHEDPTRSCSPHSTHSLGGGATSRAGTHTSHSNGSFVGPPGSWSEWADEDLLMNLGPRERTRQEVLWEIVSSEERYVNDLVQLVDTFINALLPPRQQVGSPTLAEWSPSLGSPDSHSHHPLTATTSPVHWASSLSPPPHASRPNPTRTASAASVEHLPIAARFLSSIGTQDAGPASTDIERQASGSSGESSNQFGLPVHHPVPLMDPGVKQSPYGQLHRPNGLFGPTLPFPSAQTNGGGARSHQSLPPPARHQAPSSPPMPFFGSSTSPNMASSGGAGRSASVLSGRTKFVKSPGSSVSGDTELMGLPDDLREVLEVLRDGILGGHLALSRALKKRYEEQYPLVRSLADVFTQHSYVLREYNVYVLHLSNALGVVDSALTSGAGKKARKAEEGTEVARLRGVFQELDELAADKGESGLAISLSKPFQRLLKYPLLLQNLLYNTDPSTKEYEATVAMVEEVEHIIRSIEDEKTAVEERVKTRDIFARIEGLEREKMLIAPKPSRLLVDETPCGADGTKISAQAAARRQAPVAAKEKKTFRRLSDILKPTVGGNNDLWIVRFNDVSLLCQRTGTTSLPLASTASSRSASLPELNGKAKFATTGRKHVQNRPRNLYRFVKVEEWTMAGVVLPRHGMTSMDDISRSRALITQPHGHPDERDEDDEALEDDGNDSDGSFGGKSRMSFSYWGGDSVEPMPALDPRVTPAANRRAVSSTGQASKTTGAPLIRRLSAKEKFGSRLRSPEPIEPRSTTKIRAGGATSVAGGKRAITPSNPGKPSWNSSTSSSTPAVKPKLASSSAGHLPLGRTAAPLKKHLSPSPSEDSGVAMAAIYMSKNDSRVSHQ